ncbi:MAG: hypothetical protein IAG13_02280 [Deltaproteobacteria bacterium]|nr:hypothetical protein [Nannocystaceae bacterium]
MNAPHTLATLCLTLIASSACALDDAEHDLGESDATSSSDGETHDEPPGYTVVDPRAQYLGRSSAEWGAAWWAWALALPGTGHPLLGGTADCALGQSGPVLFIGSLAGASLRSDRGGALRRCTVSSDTAVLVPIVNVTRDNVGAAPDDHATDAQLAAAARSYVDDMDIVALVVDGDVLSAAALAHHRAGAHRGRYALPDADSVLERFGVAVTERTVDPSFGDGIYVMLELEPGLHTLDIAALDVRDPADDLDDLVIEVSYELDVRDGIDESHPHP